MKNTLTSEETKHAHIHLVLGQSDQLKKKNTVWIELEYMGTPKRYKHTQL